MAPLLLILVLAPTQTDALARHLAWMTAHPNFSVDVTATTPGRPPAKGTLIVESGKRILYRAKWGTSDFSLSNTEKGYVEIERGSRLYDEHSSAPFGIFQSRISPAYSTAPSMLLRHDYHQVVPRGADIKLSSSAEGSVAECVVTTPMAKVSIRGVIDSAGRLTKYRRIVDGADGHSEMEWTFAKYTPIAKPALSAFLTPLPLGFVPFALPEGTEPLQKGRPAPLAGWRSPDGSAAPNLKTLAGGKPILLALLGKGSDPSTRAAGALARLASTCTVFRLSDGAGMPGAYSDPTGKLLAQLDAPATPTFWLVGTDGLVKKVWMGFDIDAADAFERDVIETAKAK